MSWAWRGEVFSASNEGRGEAGDESSVGLGTGETITGLALSGQSDQGARPVSVAIRSSRLLEEQVNATVKAKVLHLLYREGARPNTGALAARPLR